MKSNLEIKTSFVSPVTLKLFTECSYLPVFILRNISNSELIGGWSNSALHLKNLSPSVELFRAKRDNLIDIEEFKKKYIIEQVNLNYKNLIIDLENLRNLSNARGIVLMGYGSDDKICHRSILADLLNSSDLLDKKITEVIL